MRTNTTIEKLRISTSLRLLECLFRLRTYPVITIEYK